MNFLPEHIWAQRSLSDPANLEVGHMKLLATARAQVTG